MSAALATTLTQSLPTLRLAGEPAPARPPALALAGPPDRLPALTVLAGFKTALVPLADAPALLRLDEGAAFDLLAELEDEGLVESFTDGAEPSVILSPLGASRAGVGLQATSGRRGALGASWAKLGAVAEPRERPSKRLVVESDHFAPDSRGLDSLADPGALQARDIVRDVEPPPKGRRKPFVFNARIVLGTGIAWPASVEEDGSCSGCRGWWRRRNAVCLVCQRAGDLDGPDAMPVKDRHVGGRKRHRPAGKAKAVKSPMLDRPTAKPRGFVMRSAVP